MYTIITAKEAINEALKMSYIYYADDSTWQPIVSIREQLKYLLDAVENKNDRSMLNQIIIGNYAVKEFEQAHEDFADALYVVCEVLTELKKNRL